MSGGIFKTDPSYDVLMIPMGRFKKSIKNGLKLSR